MTTAEVLRAAAKRLREQGWQQGAYGQYGLSDGGPCCVRGAIFSVTDPICAYKEEQNAGMCLYRTLRDRDESCSLVAWNDTPGRTAEEVIALLEDTAAELEARP